MREMILAGTKDERARALAKLLPVPARRFHRYLYGAKRFARDDPLP